MLLTERMALRRMTGADAVNLVSLDGDPLVMRFLDRKIRSLAEIRDEVIPHLTGCHRRYPGFGYWAAELRTGGEFIGWFGLRPVMPADQAMVHWPDPVGVPEVAELGYRLRHSTWGHGYATEGARAVVRRAFTELAVREIVATTMAVNAGSRRVMEKAGLTFARTVHLDWPDPLNGTEHGEVEYRLLRDDWIRSARSAGRPDARADRPEL
jgi:RimJ/RimL family protein N-acetyltransferase